MSERQCNGPQFRPPCPRSSPHADLGTWGATPSRCSVCLLSLRPPSWRPRDASSRSQRSNPNPGLGEFGVWPRVPQLLKGEARSKAPSADEPLAVHHPLLQRPWPSGPPAPAAGAEMRPATTCSAPSSTPGSAPLTLLSPSWVLLRSQTHVVPARRPPGAPTGDRRVGYGSLMLLLWKVCWAQPPTVTPTVTGSLELLPSPYEQLAVLTHTLA